MMEKIACSELGIRDCDFEASGETTADVVREVVEHLEETHGLDMPDADMILSGGVNMDSLKLVDAAAALILERLTEQLAITPTEEPQVPRTPPPPGGTTAG